MPKFKNVYKNKIEDNGEFLMKHMKFNWPIVWSV
jgi:hypothetical protein